MVSADRDEGIGLNHICDSEFNKELNLRSVSSKCFMRSSFDWSLHYMTSWTSCFTMSELIIWFDFLYIGVVLLIIKIFWKNSIIIIHHS